MTPTPNVCNNFVRFCLAACYGIVQVPTGPWFCRKCESQERAARVVSLHERFCCTLPFLLRKDVRVLQAVNIDRVKAILFLNGKVCTNIAKACTRYYLHTAHPVRATGHELNPGNCTMV